MFAILKHLFKLQFLIILLAVLAGIYYPQILEKIKIMFLELLGENTSIPLEFKDSEQLFTKSELSQFNGESAENTPIYLSILGSVYDVTRGKKHYGPGCSYNYFVGRDASKSFITGEFEEFNEHSDDVNAMSPSDLLGLENWKNFYDKDYTYKGKLIGRFFDESGGKTKYHHHFDALINKAKKAKLEAEQMKDMYPDCNIEWSEKTGTRVWCTTQSGGTTRSWAGYPRKFYQMGNNEFRCACIRKDDLGNTALMIKPYDNCDPLSNTCNYQVE